MIYFVAQTANPTFVKVGQTDDLDSRLQAIAGSFEDGIDLLAVYPGGAEVEAFLHKMLLNDRVEGEWFRRSPILSAIIDRFSSGAIQHFAKRPVRETGNAADDDVKLAIALTRKLLDAVAGVSDGIMVAQERAFNLLHTMNPMWMRRRVRALWEGTPRRIEHYEILNLKGALALATASDWIEGDDR